jgi:hypothetical protein
MTIDEAFEALDFAEHGGSIEPTDEEVERTLAAEVRRLRMLIVTLGELTVPCGPPGGESPGHEAAVVAAIRDEMARVRDEKAAAWVDSSLRRDEVAELSEQLAAIVHERQLLRHRLNAYESHGPEGHNVTNLQYQQLRQRLVVAERHVQRVLAREWIDLKQRDIEVEKAAFMAGYYAEWEGPPLWDGRWVFDPRDCGIEPEEVFAAWQKSKAKAAE